MHGTCARRRAHLLGVALVVGCTGSIAERAVPGDTGGTGGTGRAPPGASACAATPNPGRSPLRRLNQAEYLNTVAELLGMPETADVAGVFPPDEQGGGFSNNADALVVTGLLAGSYIDAAEKLAAMAVAKLAALLPCDPQQLGETACATLFVQRLGRRAFRRPLRADEQTRYLALYTQGRASSTFAEGIELVLRGLLQSPHFLYRVEVGQPPAAPGASVVEVTPHELASRLSYGLWSGMPDEALFTAADSGRLATPAGIEAEARRMLGDRRARQAIAGFHREWFQIDEVGGVAKDKTAFPTWSPSLRNDLRTELETFVDDAFWADGRLETLLAAPHSFLNAALAKHYGVTAPAGTGFARVELDPTRRAGLLTNGALLALHAKSNQTSPVHRGVFVREKLLCSPLPAPPAVDADGKPIVIVPPVVDPGSSTRERFTRHSSDPYCAACHRLMDPIGFGFESYDGVGRWRTMDGRFAVDPRGEVVATTDADGPFDGAVELAHRLAASADARRCVALQVFRYAAGRADTKGDSCTLERLQKKFADTGYDMRELWVAMATSDALRYRAMTGGGE